MKAVIVDDEYNGRDGLKNILQGFFAEQVTVVDMAKDVSTAIQSIAAHAPDLVFLDIHMPDGTGFDVLQQSPFRHHFHVVFITGHSEPALQAFDYSAYDYLLKPVGIKALRTIIENLDTSRPANPYLDELIENYTGQVQTLVVPTLAGFEKTGLKDLLRVESENEAAVFFTKDGTVIRSTAPFRKYETLLAAKNFLRVNPVVSINLNEIKKYRKEENLIDMSDGVEIALDPERKNIFAQRFTGR